MLGEASWLLSHAPALADYGRSEEAAGELARAASCEEQVACLLEADGQELEAAIHRVSAAACYGKLGQSTRAVTLLRAALSADLRDDAAHKPDAQARDFTAFASHARMRVGLVCNVTIKALQSTSSAASSQRARNCMGRPRAGRSVRPPAFLDTQNSEAHELPVGMSPLIGRAATSGCSSSP
jgi:hypothetical protein